MEAILFPFENMRKSQDLFIDDFIKALNSNKHFLMHAPTGLGKTAILGPVLAYALKNKKIIFFITPIHTQHRIAIDILRKIKGRYDKDFIAVDLIGKKWMCLQPNISNLFSSEFSDYCNNMVEKGLCEFHSRIKNKFMVTVEAKQVLRKLEILNPLDVEKLCEICASKKLCPFEISCLLAKKAVVIIADYYHALSKPIRDSILQKIGKQLSDAVVIVDEAHNLVHKTRDLLTVNLSTFTLELAAREAMKFGYGNMVKKLKELFLILEKFAKEKIDLETPEALIARNEFIARIKDYDLLKLRLRMVAEYILEKKKRSFCNPVYKFLEAWLGPDEGFARILSRVYIKGKPYVNLSYRCLDPSFILAQLAAEARIACMSGTLTPTSMYRDLFGFDAVLKEYNDPFPKENRLNLIVPKTTTQYSKRGPEMYHKIAVLTSKLANAIPGNSAIFFPSYKLRDDVYEYFSTLCEKTIVLEQHSMSKKERNNLLEKFKRYKDEGAVLLGCISGSFAEGIDLKGDFLKGVIVVGLPLSKPDLETDELIKYYDKKFGKGRHYGYVYPAMLKTIQGAGRCIRSEEDIGVIVFLDERYIWKNYYKCFPADWNLKITERPVHLIEEFFK